VRQDATHVRGRARLGHERLDRRGCVSAVSLRLDNGVADLDRALLVDERATDLANHDIVVSAVNQEGTELTHGADALRNAD
jgi:hypothetical protein